MTREAYTDENGAYVITGLRETSRYDIDAYKENWEIDTAPGGHRHDELAGSVIDLVGKPVVVLPVSIELADGGEPFKARVEWQRDSRSGSERWYPHEPMIKLRPGAYTLRVKAGDEHEFASDPQEITLSLSEPPPPVSFVIGPRIGVRGMVLFPEGEAPEYASVYMAKCSREESPDDRDLLSSNLRDYAYRGNAFKYDFKDVEPGSYLLGVSRSRRRIDYSELVEVGGELVRHDLRVPPLQPDEYLVLWVKAPDGSFTNDLQASISNSWSLGTALKKKDGSLLLPLDPERVNAAQGPPTSTLTVYSSKLGRKSVEITRDQREVTVEFGEPAFLEVTVGGYRGSGLENQLALYMKRVEAPGGTPGRMIWGGSSGRSRAIDSDGRQTFGPIEPGDYDILLTLNRSGRGAAKISQLQVALVVGENRATMDLPRLYSLTVETNLSPGTSIRLQSAESDSPAYRDVARVEETGSVVFEHVPAGNYKLFAYAGGRAVQMEVSIPARGSIYLEAPPSASPRN
jgi:hypothetical protein